MAVSPTPPSISLLPPAPLPTDPEAVFDAKAGARLTAEEVMVAEQNAALAWQAGSMAETKGYKGAAATSAGNAAESAELAQEQVGLIAEQVEAAVEAREGAEAAESSALAAAAAAGAAAGLPSLVGNGGRALCAKLDETGVEWKTLSQAVGEVLITTGIPDATYVLPETIYTRAAYPELFAVVGTRDAYNDGANFAAQNYGVTPYLPSAAACGKDNVIISVGITSGSYAANNSVALKSTDFGLTWTPIAALANRHSLVGVDTDGNGVWFILAYDGRGYRSTDNGATWSVAITANGYPANQSFPGTVVCNRAGVWISCLLQDGTYLTYSRSTDNGLTWISNNFGTSMLCQGVVANYVNGDFWFKQNQYYLYRSIDAGLTWKNAYSVGANGSLMIPVINAGVVVFSHLSSLFISMDGGNSFKTIMMMSGVAFIDNNGVITVNSVGRYYKSYDYGETWTVSTQAVINPIGNIGGFNQAIFYNSATGVWLLGNSTQWYRSTRLYNYDVATQFKTPPVKAGKGYKAYIKGKVQ